MSLNHLVEHWGDVAVGAASGISIWSFIGYGVNTAPTPAGPWGRWFLGLLKYAVGQFNSARNVMRGNETLVMEVQRGSGGVASAIASTDLKQSKSVEINPETITITDHKESKTTIPNPSQEGPKT